MSSDGSWLFVAAMAGLILLLLLGGCAPQRALTQQEARCAFLAAANAPPPRGVLGLESAIEEQRLFRLCLQGGV